MDYNRVIKNLNGHTASSFLEALNEKFYVTTIGAEAYKPKQAHEFGFYTNNVWYKLVAKEGSFSNDALGILDITILQQNILSPLLNIQDQRTNTNIDFVGGIRGLAELEKPRKHR